MKILISADMEGIACVGAREEVTKGERDYDAASAQMTAEVAAVLEGAYAAGVTHATVKDAHWTGRNLDAARLNAPEGRELRLIRGWSGHPFSMVQGLDESYDAVLFVGYHAAASRAGNPLAHTLASRLLAQVRINEHVASEFLIFSLAASLVKVPVVFLAGDGGICREARDFNPGIETVATFEGSGPSIVSLTPSESCRRIRLGVAAALAKPKPTILRLPDRFQVSVDFRDPAEAYRRSFYPGARLQGDLTVAFETPDYFEVLRLLKFLTL